jgi:p-hydroxybenzoate 3-monooxygenase
VCGRRARPGRAVRGRALKTLETQVAIVGAGPAGLTLALLLQNAGIDSVVIENRSREYVEHRVRAGVLEHDVAELLRSAGAGDRMDREGLVHHGVHLQFAGERHRVPLSELTDGRTLMVYGQTEVVKDLVAGRIAAGLPLLFDVSDVTVHDIESQQPHVDFDHDGERYRVKCDVIAGCDGFHGICRPAIDQVLRTFSREYPFAWLGILADAAPSSEELVYAHHTNGFALLSLRSPTRSRLYLQCAPDEDLELWPDERIWAELAERTTLDGWTLDTGPIVEKGVTGMRSFVAEPMSHGRLFLTGDAAHIVPPTGAKGLNLAIRDVSVLAQALEGWYRRGDEAGLNAYSDLCLRRVWRAEHFSWWMTSMLHRHGDEFDEQLQLSQLRYVVSSPAAARSLAENYVGLFTV